MKNMNKRVCRQCSNSFEGGPRAWYCPVCRKERQKIREKEHHRNGPARKLGSIDKCIACGMEYIVEGGLQKYCKKCAPEEVAKTDRKQGLEWYYKNKDWVNPKRDEKRRVKTKTCVICEKEFPCDGTPRSVCSDKCFAIRKQQYQQRGEVKRKKMKKIDFAIIITAQKCNPNGDPSNKNMPRQDYDGYGEISDVCIKRKIRDRLEENGEKILMSRNDLMDEDMLFSVKDRVDAVPELKKIRSKKNPAEYLKYACNYWYDVRAFGQMFPFKDFFGTATLSVRGPVSIGIATSLEPILIMPMSITKATNIIKNDPGRDSASYATKYIIDHAAYVAYGSIFPQLAEKSGFNKADAEKLKNAMIHLLDNDASSSRPAGSMSSTLFWAEHNTEYGNLPSHKVHKMFGIEPSTEYPYFKYDIKNVPGIKIEVY